jgi:hypothetical protein
MSRNKYFPVLYPFVAHLLTLPHRKRHVSAATVMHAAIEELWEAVFPAGPCRGYVRKIETQLSQSGVEWKSSSEAGSPRYPEAEIVAPGGGVGRGKILIVVSLCVATSS